MNKWFRFKCAVSLGNISEVRCSMGLIKPNPILKVGEEEEEEEEEEGGGGGENNFLEK